MLQKCEKSCILMVKILERMIMKDLIIWKENPSRKPLILKGARQVGKTYILKKFGEKYYKNTAYFNFDHDDKLYMLFENTKDPQRIIEQLILENGKKIEPEETLIIFDEIQECPNALNSLKYFCEEAGDYHIACAGSLLGIRLSHTSFPVGKVNFLELYPVSFSEFLIADQKPNLVEYLKKIKEPVEIPSAFSTQLEEKLKVYFIVGGMPEAVDCWVKEKDIEKVEKILEQILVSYENDFSKHTTNNEANKISLIWNGIPSQLAKENKKIYLSSNKRRRRSREYEGALNWLKDANLISKVYNVKKVSLPLKSYQDLNSFKIYMNDVGLLRKMSNLESSIILEENKLFEEFKGIFAENYVLNMLTTMYNKTPYYYTFERYEIDFIIQENNQIIPIEVKSSERKKHKSLTKYNSENDNELSICFSMDNLKKDGKVLHVPLYLVEYINSFL